MTDTCGCCAGVESITPQQVSNRPGLDALSYRVGTHGAFLDSMQARLSQVEVETKGSAGNVARERPLGAFTTRDPGDPAIALLDAWATVADVLTFYQERIANEGYLRTARERRSILELARLVGYTLRPGVASTVYLAYTVDENLKEKTDIPLYSASQTVPGPGELSQTFETVEKLEAHAQWNNLKPRLTRPQTMKSIASSRKVYLKGVATNLKPGDPLLIDDGINPTLWRIAQVNAEVSSDGKQDRTVVQIIDWKYAAPAPISAMAAVTKDIALKYGEKTKQVVVEALRATDSRTSKAANLARQVLERLSMSKALDFATLEFQVENTLTELKDIRAELPTSARVVRRWLDKTIRKLSAARSDATESLAAASARELGERLVKVEPPGDYVPPRRSSDELLQVMRGLSLPPSIPPRNASYIRRDLKTAFQRRSDLGLQVVGTVKPEIAALLPLALAKVQATRDLPVQVYALRVKAGLYGSTAPKRPIVDDKGRVVATTDWAIDGSRRIQVHVGGFGSGAKQATVLIQSKTSGGAFESVSLVVGPKDNPTASSHEISVQASMDESPQYRQVKVTFTIYQLSQTLTFLLDSNGLMSVSSTASDHAAFDPIVITDDKTVVTSSGRLSEISLGLRGSDIVYATEVPLAPMPRDVIRLDAPYDQVTPGSRAVVVRDSQKQLIITQVDAVSTVARNDYNLPAKVTNLTLDDNWLSSTDLYLSDIADTVVLANSEALDLAEEPIDEPICGADQWIELDGLYSGLEAGRWLIVAGQRADIKDETDQTVSGLESAELVMLADVQHDIYRGQTLADDSSLIPTGKGQSSSRDESKGVAPLPGDTNHTFIRLSSALSFCYARDKVTIYGNVVKATHGESRSEVLGAGNGTKAFQAFDLKQVPLTFVSAPTAAGSRSTLRVYVNNVQWHEAQSFVELGPTDHGFVTKSGDNDKVTVIAGNGKTGARLPTGPENVRALYRQGIGKVGNARPKQISLLKSRPLGVKEVINPLRASGGADREIGDQARKNVPLGVMSLDRLVSVQDYADFSRTFAGIGKAVSARLPFGDRELVHVTIAGADDIPIDASSDLYRNLVYELWNLGDPDVPVRVETRELLLLTLQAQVDVLPDYLWDVVAPAIRQSLYSIFSFGNQELGEDVWLSQVISAIQSVEGVAYVNVEVLGAIPEKKTDGDGSHHLLTPDQVTQAVQQLVEQQAKGPAQRVPVGLATVIKRSIQPAQLAFLSSAVPGTLILNQTSR